MNKAVTLATAASLAFGLIGDAGAERPTRVFEDPAGDAGISDSLVIPEFDQAGFDLVSGDITRAGPHLEFKVTHASMPASGSLPEGARFMWIFKVDRQLFKFSIKSQDLGKPDPVGFGGTERVGRVDLNGHFRLERCIDSTDPYVGVPMTRCILVAFEDGVFDPAAKAFTVTIPLRDIAAVTGSIVSGHHNPETETCPICWIGHVAERSSAPEMILDATDQAIVYRVPGR